MSDLQETLEGIINTIRNPSEGLPEEVFLFATQITPMVNVDLLIRDSTDRLLLSWRDDSYCGCGWHVPGGIIRLKETFSERIQKTALKELGCMVLFDPAPLEVREIIQKQRKIRSHFITFVYSCRLPAGETIHSQKHFGENGYLKWHNVCPENMIPCHHFYRKYFKTFGS